MPQITRSKYVIYDPATKLFMSKAGYSYEAVGWTDQFDQIQANVTPERAMALLKHARQTVPDAEVMEANFSMTWKPVTLEIRVEDTPRYKKHKDIYERFLPTYLVDADAIPTKDWLSFKAARTYLAEHGVAVVKL